MIRSGQDVSSSLTWYYIVELVVVQYNRIFTQCLHSEREDGLPVEDLPCIVYGLFTSSVTYLNLIL